MPRWRATSRQRDRTGWYRRYQRLRSRHLAEKFRTAVEQRPAITTRQTEIPTGPGQRISPSRTAVTVQELPADSVSRFVGGLPARLSRRLHVLHLPLRRQRRRVRPRAQLLAGPVMPEGA